MAFSIAEVFVEARRTGAVIDAYPGEKPNTLAAAYRIQDAAIAHSGRSVGGWKVGRIAADLVPRFGTDRIAGPIFTDAILEADRAEPIPVAVLAGFAAIEAELLLRVRQTPPPGIGIDSAPEYIDMVRFGFEVASSPFPGINDFGPTVTVSDFGNNFGLVLGPSIADWRDRDLLGAPVTLAIDGDTVGNARLADMLDGPFGAFCFLADALRERGRMLEPGQWVSTGAITGVHPIAPGQRADATFDSAYPIACRATRFAATGAAQGGNA